MRLAGGLGHLSYCTNIHAAEHWPDVERGLRQHLPRIKAEVSPDAPMGVGIRIAASAARSLEQPQAMEQLRELLGEDFYIFTVNGFPYGTFHGQRVKEGAYAPDWTQPERLAYTNRLASQLAGLLPEGVEGSVSTVPCTYKPWLRDAADAGAKRSRIVEHLIQHAAHLVTIRERTGKAIMLTLEPEPFCLLETIEETIAFFQESLLGADAAARLAALTRRSAVHCEEDLRRHLGVCYDVCHAAVEFEDPRGSIEALRAAGIAIGKLQLSSALKLEVATRDTARALEPFNEPVYLHQTIERRDGRLTRFEDLDDAFASLATSQGGEWRSHFHVPIFLEKMEHFSTTQDFLREILALHRARPISQHLEVETYTWDVLPAAYRSLDLSSAIARELGWVRERLA
jgi:sugar phosphate isomerase/epimerase